ncbi:DNA ligase 6, partial [Haematococcus lacustris]
VITACYLATGRIAAAHEQGGELHVGEATVAAAVRESCGISRARMSALYKQLGDLGDVAQKEH